MLRRMCVQNDRLKAKTRLCVDDRMDQIVQFEPDTQTRHRTHPVGQAISGSLYNELRQLDFRTSLCQHSTLLVVMSSGELGRRRRVSEADAQAYVGLMRPKIQ